MEPVLQRRIKLAIDCLLFAWDRSPSSDKKVIALALPFFQKALNFTLNLIAVVPSPFFIKAFSSKLYAFSFL